MNRTALAAVLAMGGFLAMTGGASALVTVSLIDTSTQGGGNDADVYGAGYNATVPAGASFSADPTVTPPPGNQPGVYQSPFNNTALLQTQSYFSVGEAGTAGGVASPVTLDYTTDQTFFSILWGSIDTYNTISFFDNGSLVASYTGTDIVNEFTLPDNSTNPGNFEVVALLDFSFTGLDKFDAVKFESSTNAFEFALPVPIPAALPMLLAAVSGLGLAGWRSNRRPA